MIASMHFTSYIQVQLIVYHDIHKAISWWPCNDTL